METMLFTAAVHDRSGFGVIDSRIGLMASAYAYRADTDLRAAVEAELRARRLDCVLIDEAQFLSRRQVLQLASIADDFGIPVLAYGLRTDFQGQLFEGSGALLALADSLVELKAVCECGRKAIMNLRVDAAGRAVKSGAQTEVGGNERYLALCRRHFMQRLADAGQGPLPLELAADAN
jgi:thymidine kinase